MPQIVSCPECAKKLRVPDDLVGQKVRCPGCNGMFMAKLPGAGASPRAEEPTRRAPPRAPVRDDAIEEGPRPGRAERRVSPSRRDDRDDYDEPPRRRRRDEEDEDDYDDRPRSRRRREEEEEDEDYPRSRRRRYEDEEEDYEDEGPAPRSVREGWRKVRSGINFVIISIWVLLGSIAVGWCGGFAIGAAGVGSVGSSRTPGQAAGSIAATGAGFVILILVSFVLGLVVTGLRLFGYAQCMGVPPRRGSSIKTLAVVAFWLGIGAAATQYLSQIINWARFGLVAAGANPFAVMGGSGGVIVALSGLGALAGLASFFVFCFFLRSVCLEVRKPGLAKTIVSFLIAIGATVGLALLVAILTVVIIGTAFFSALGGGGSRMSANTLGGLMLVFAGLFCILALVALGLFVWYIVILHQVRGAVDNHLYRTR